MEDNDPGPVALPPETASKDETMTSQDSSGLILSFARTLFVKFTTSALQAPDPPAWSVLLLDSHPPVADRIAMAEAWRRRNR